MPSTTTVILFDHKGLRITPGIRSNPKPAAPVLVLRIPIEGSAVLESADVLELQRVLAWWMAGVESG